MATAAEQQSNLGKDAFTISLNHGRLSDRSIANNENLAQAA
jgi:hypothetical protein